MKYDISNWWTEDAMLKYTEAICKTSPNINVCLQIQMQLTL